MAFGDLDGDGLHDAVLVTTTTMELFLGKPQGGFQTKVILLESDSGYQRVHLADLDGDGDLDVLYATSGIGRIRWIENLGGAVFAPFRGVAGIFSSIGQLNTKDLDGDGDLDVYCSHQTFNGTSFEYANIWIPNQLPGTFGAPQAMSMSDVMSNGLGAEDLDADGDLDLYAFFDSSGTLIAWRNDGSGAFGPGQVVAQLPGGVVFVRVVDLDTDGNLDLVASVNSLGGTGSAFLGDGSGSFGPEIELDFAWASASLIDIADIDADGRLDLVLNPGSGELFTWLRNTSSPGIVAFDPPLTIGDGAQQNVPSSKAFSDDVDGNGTLDVAVISVSWDSLSWFSNDGFGSFQPRAEITASASYAIEALAVDFDGDGDMDVFSVSSEDRKVALYESLGGGQFENQRAIAIAPEDPASLAVGDLDGDGRPDLLIGAISNSDLTWHRNLGNGEFGPATTVSIGASSANYLAIVDLGGDGFADILVASRFGDSIIWVPNEPGTGLGFAQELTGDATNASSVAGADLDGDGDRDVLFTSLDVGPLDQIAWMENLGAGQFSSPIEVSPLFKARRAVPVDIDGDGLSDVVACGSETFSYTNTGGGQFAAAQQVNGLSALDVDVSDADGDGDPDVLLVRGNRLLWHKRTPAGGWSFARLVEADLPDPLAASFVDLDGDGDQDVLYAGGLANTVSWYENLLDPSVGIPDCDPGVVNSTGQPGSLTGVGSPWIPNNALTLTADNLPANQVGLFLASPSAGFVVGAGGSQGNLCLSGPIGRFREPGQIQSTDIAGTLALSVDLTQIPSPSGFVSVLMGEQWHFQLWHRDQNPGPTSNFTNALVIAYQ